MLKSEFLRNFMDKNLARANTKTQTQKYFADQILQWFFFLCFIYTCASLWSFIITIFVFGYFTLAIMERIEDSHGP